LLRRSRSLILRVLIILFPAIATWPPALLE
jgi:hypothetical protein